MSEAKLERKKIAVLISGRGSNMTALIKAAMDPSFPARIALVISNKASAHGLNVAKEFGIETLVLRSKNYDSREAYDAAVDTVLQEQKIELVCLAGFMRILSENFVRKWSGRMINIHPSLLPAFKGLDTHKRALTNGVKLHGCTVHFVSEGMDEGPIILQAAVPVLDEDTEETLSARVLEQEHVIYPKALEWLAKGQLRITGQRVRFAGDTTQNKCLISPYEPKA
jgi:formyltetrahydrofolate-dependent phosphoribosylglycinamide formyltransferase